jgi:predicted nucleotidyltransferase
MLGTASLNHRRHRSASLRCDTEVASIAPLSAGAGRVFLQIVAQVTAALLPRAEILEVYLFGSLARGDDQAHSDVDVAVVVADAALDQPGLGYHAELGADLQQALARTSTS